MCASKKIMANIISKDERLYFCPEIAMQGCHLLPLIFNSRLAVLSISIRQEREVQIGKEELD